jgi:hypothetical protein
MEIVRYLKKGVYDRIVISGIASPSAILDIEQLRISKIPYFIEEDGRAIEEIVKKYRYVKKHKLRLPIAWLHKIFDFMRYRFKLSDVGVYVGS